MIADGSAQLAFILHEVNELLSGVAMSDNPSERTLSSTKVWPWARN
jgi:hypothetical protein